jgi:hypothetical protein
MLTLAARASCCRFLSQSRFLLKQRFLYVGVGNSLSDLGDKISAARISQLYECA